MSRIAGRSANSETIYRGDTLRISVFTGFEDDDPAPWLVRVDTDGTAELPLIGAVKIAGANLAEAEELIRQTSVSRDVFRNPNVSVAIGKRRINRVTVTGAVNRPGPYEIPTVGSNLAAALIAAGGLSENADRVVTVRQPDMTGSPSTGSVVHSSLNGRGFGLNDEPNSRETEIDLVSASNGTSGEVTLYDGAVVTVKERPNRVVHMIGLTGNRSIKLPPNRDVSVLEALSQSGGPRYSNWICDKIRVIRQVPNTDESVTIKVSMRQAKRRGETNILLAPGDIISVEENPITFTIGTLGALVGIGVQAASGAAVGL